MVVESKVNKERKRRRLKQTVKWIFIINKKVIPFIEFILNIDTFYFTFLPIKTRARRKEYFQSICQSFLSKKSKLAPPPYPTTRSGELRTQKSKPHLVRTQSFNVFPLKPGVGQYIAIHATLTARNFFLAYFYLPVHSPAFFPNLYRFFLCWLWLTHGSCVGP